MSEFLLILLSNLVGGVSSKSALAWKLARGRVPCACRSEDGAIEGLAPRWRHGHLVFTGSEFRFISNFGRHHTPVLRLASDVELAHTGPVRKSVPAHCAGLVVLTGAGELNIAVMQDDSPAVQQFLTEKGATVLPY